MKLENDFIKDGDTYTLKDEIVDSLLEQFPERDAILFKLPDFFSQFDKGLRENGYEYKRDLITYYNEKKQTHPLEYEKYEGNPFLGLFYKRGFFKLQKEYRIALADFSDEDVIINIGNIRGCTEVWSIETIRGLRVQMIEIEEG
ncbi:hypothetical protein J2Z82_000442 [Virgibacillus litoralis]|uniref:Uncharacterized protein n=1 Tax=Virgibacillus litoralis TaxID=578221 RepID=A0ABS4HA37_9BACI|nr:hypothetical protein [Virgibacillus litoralis]